MGWPEMYRCYRWPDLLFTSFYINVGTYVYICGCMYVNVYIYMYVHIYVYMYMYVYVYMCVYHILYFKTFFYDLCVLSIYLIHPTL